MVHYLGCLVMAIPNFAILLCFFSPLVVLQFMVGMAHEGSTLLFVLSPKVSVKSVAMSI